MVNQRLFTRHLEDDEEIIAVIHKHWLLGVKHLLWPSATFLFLAGLLVITQFQLYVFYVTAAMAMCTVVWFVRNYLDYFLDAWIITDTGIVDVEWHGWFHRESSRILYSDIQGVSYTIQGVSETLFRYGTISVEKVSTGNAISLESVSRPRAVEALILQQMEDYLHSKNLKDAGAVQEILTSVIARELNLKEVEKVNEQKNKKVRILRKRP